MTRLVTLIVCLALQLQEASSWSAVPTSHKSLLGQRSSCSSQQQQQQQQQRPLRSLSILNNAVSSAIPAPEESSPFTTEAPSPSTDAGEIVPELSKKERLKKQALKEGGIFTFNTKYGALNPYAIYYGVTSIFLGLFWFVALTGLQFLYFVTGGRVDKRKGLVNFVSQIWGETLMFLVRARPEFIGKEQLKEFYKKNQAAMFVANHNSWLDIPFVGGTIGWRNYKLVSKAELGRVPILGKAIKLGGHIMVDRSNRKSQIKTLRHGMDLLKNGIHLCTFPEGTRTKNGRLLPFKNGAFKMAHKVGAPIIPLSIVGSGEAMPYYWMFPFRAARHIGAKVIIHPPIASDDKTEEELAKQVRAAVISGLPEHQRPLDE